MKKYRFVPGGLLAAGVVVWASSAVASPAFLSTPSLSDLGSGMSRLPSLLVMALAEERPAHGHHEAKVREEADARERRAQKARLRRERSALRNLEARGEP